MWGKFEKPVLMSYPGKSIELLILTSKLSGCYSNHTLRGGGGGGGGFYWVLRVCVTETHPSQSAVFAMN